MVVRLSLWSFVILLAVVQGELKWDKDNWSLGCDFTGNELKNEPMKASECANKCAETEGCTHYMWNKYKKGTCWMKQGCVTKDDAVETGDNKVFCGIIAGHLNKCKTERPIPPISKDLSVVPSAQYSLESISLMLHNAFRARHCAPPLQLDEELKKSAQTRAEENAAADDFVQNKPADVGEYNSRHVSIYPIFELRGIEANLFMYNQVEQYNFNRPGYSPTTVGFTHMVWKNSVKMGVGYAFTPDKRRIYVVFHYSPEGSLIENFRENVFPAQC